jgi:predicted acylesterase/phospholipase RssA
MHVSRCAIGGGTWRIKRDCHPHRVGDMRGSQLPDDRLFATVCHRHLSAPDREMNKRSGPQTRHQRPATQAAHGRASGRAIPRSAPYLAQWLQPILDELGVQTFADLKIDQSDDPGMTLPANRRYRLVVHTSDITRGELVRLPWDYAYYGLPADEQGVAGAVRASMSIPFFFEPVTIQANEASIDVAMPDGSVIRQHYDAGTVTWTHGGMLRNFPIGAFDRVDGQPARWPTIGIKLSSLPTRFGATQASRTALSVAIRALHTIMNEWDRYNVEETTAARTIFVDNAGLKATQFDLGPDQQDELFINGVRAATRFIIEMSQAGGVPRNADQAKQFVLARKAAASR